MNGRFQSRLVGAVSGVAAIAVATAAHAPAAVIGPKDLSESDGASTCLTPICTLGTPKIPGTPTTAPFSGTITLWKASVSTPHDSFVNDGPLSLQVLKRTVDKPGFADDRFEALRETVAEDATPGAINSFEADLRIRKGQFIGLKSTSDTEIRGFDASAAVRLAWNDGLEVQAPARKPDFNIPGGAYLFNAKVKR
jgi:hypothetical protein